MRRTSAWLAAFVAWLAFPAVLMAGGPPRLCLPIAGVTRENASACAELLTSKLEDKLWPRDEGIRLRQHSDQWWYVTFFMRRDVRLSDVATALEGSSFSVPSDRLRLFGHVILTIEAGENEPGEPARDRLLADLEALAHVSVAESQQKGEYLLVTVDMPYPAGEKAFDEESVGWDKFQRNDFSSDQRARSESPATSQTLPGYEALRDVVARHMMSLTDLRWSVEYACRPLGAVAAPGEPPEATASAGK